MPTSDEPNLPRGWPKTVRSGVLHALALANVVLANVVSKKRGATNDLRGDRANTVLREIDDIRRARMELVPPHSRPHYTPQQRMRILELKALEGWSLARTAEIFQITEPTVAAWLARVDEQGPAALVQTPEPVNKFPQVVTHFVQKLKLACPALGKRKIAAILARQGLHLGATTVGRMLKSFPAAPDLATKPQAESQPHVVTADYPHHVWHVDLTVAPVRGWWVPWLPWSLPQAWPYGWWIAAVVDHYSRRVLHVDCFANQPSSADVQAFLAKAIRAAGTAPKYIVSDRGGQFDCPAFRRWCKRRKIKPRYGAVGKHGSIAVIERFWRTLKEHLRSLPVVPDERNAFARELKWFQEWFNEHRPHEALGGRTPNEVYERRFPAHRKPRYEPRARWQKSFSCARPWALVRGSPGARLELNVEFHGGRRHLPIVRLRRVG